MFSWIPMRSFWEVAKIRGVIDTFVLLLLMCTVAPLIVVCSFLHDRFMAVIIEKIEKLDKFKK
jgi:hypothetical protein